MLAGIFVTREPRFGEIVELHDRLDESVAIRVKLPNNLQHGYNVAIELYDEQSAENR